METTPEYLSYILWGLGIADLIVIVLTFIPVKTDKELYGKELEEKRTRYDHKRHY